MTAPPASSRDTVTIFLQGITLDLSVGAYENERHALQPVNIDIVVASDASHIFNDAMGADLTTVVNYDAIYRYLHNDLPKLGHIPLLESMAEQIVAFCLRDPRVRSVKVKLAKPAIYSGTAIAGIELTRFRGETS
jgi:dihydroneopterin aldolase